MTEVIHEHAAITAEIHEHAAIKSGKKCDSNIRENKIILKTGLKTRDLP